MHISTQINTVNFLGSKFSILPWLLPLLPKSYSFIDLFGGSMVVTLNRKPMSPITTYNDLDGDVVNFFRILRTRTEELITALYLTPHAREEYNDGWATAGDDDLERARKFFVRLKQSYLSTGAQQETKGWNSDKHETRCKIAGATNKFISGVQNLWDIVDLVRNVQIENRDFQWIVAHYATKKSLIYADPPYDAEKVSGVNQYKHKFVKDDHIRLHDCLMTAPGKIAVSGYDTNFMQNLYSEPCWKMIVGPAPKNNMRKSKARECLWVNYNPHHKLTLF